MPEHNPGQLGGTMRLGRRRTVFSKDCESVTSKLFPPVLMEYQFSYDLRETVWSRTVFSRWKASDMNGPKQKLSSPGSISFCQLPE